MDRAGTLIGGKYVLMEIAGQGGMATVWRAETRGVGDFRRDIAVKRILPEFIADEQFLTMFIEEARVCSQLQHPNIVQVHDFGKDDTDRYYLVMEWVEGLDLRRLVRAFRATHRLFPWPIAAAIGVEMLRGLSAAHERSEGPVIHRDINPFNVMVSTNGVVKLTDFGLSRAMDRRRITQPGIVKGKLAYLAPEFTLGAPPSPQSDLFAVGVVLWEMLAGRGLFTGETDVDVYLGIKELRIPPLKQLRVDLPVQLCNTVQRALEKAPLARFGSADEMLLSLTTILRGVKDRTDERAVGSTVRKARELLASIAPPPLPGRRSAR
ncbi:MAG: serine/threonine protein kinase [Deltaproteobacteria bacterium]|nr:serine/threonine protein kinase [Deltaproteobacteria bacterium]